MPRDPRKAARLPRTTFLLRDNARLGRQTVGGRSPGVPVLTPSRSRKQLCLPASTNTLLDQGKFQELHDPSVRRGRATRVSLEPLSSTVLKIARGRHFIVQTFRDHRDEGSQNIIAFSLQISVFPLQVPVDPPFYLQAVSLSIEVRCRV